ncbi:MAG: bifunctional phosphoribosylaminoimidazolecarboxamide formyltransferase/IMP cyclohydrolase [Planctomycetota bacterium]|nr:bifunctional phosphoribosylaminoimidazolecarboxamide formyltransferase/IMP cyclohydrolase [Planctomycetota bacterium]
MPPFMKIKTALLSVYDKTGIEDLGKALHDRGVKILSTGGTAAALREAGVEITEVSEHTGSPEIMNGRVKTLHPKIHGGILGVRENADHCREAEENGINFIDLVVVNLYPFQAIIEKPDVTYDEAIEMIDIGGPTMVRASAKNHRDVAIVTDPSDYARLLGELESHEGGTTADFRKALSLKAFSHTAQYDAAIAGWMGNSDRWSGNYEKVRDLRYGENPHQSASVYRAAHPEGSSVVAADVLGGKELSYNNILDLDSAFEAVKEFTRPACVIVKHNNPCGAAVAEKVCEAFSGALEGDPVSAYGGIVAFNRKVDSETANRMTEKGCFFEAVIAPGYDEEALETLKTRKKWCAKLRILDSGKADPPKEGTPTVRGIRDGILVQGQDTATWEKFETMTGTLSEAQERDLQFAWIICKHVRSNAIVLAKDEKIVGIGAGQMSRLDSSYIAVRKSDGRTKGAVAASDAFFPFPDALEILMDEGITAVAHPGGSIRDEAVIDAARKRDVTLVLTGMRHFKH